MPKNHNAILELWQSLYGAVSPERAKRAHELYHSFRAKSLASRTTFDIVADKITGTAGTIEFALVHVLWFGGWILINVGLLPIVPVFDPFPFGLMTMVVSLEAIFLSLMVLISQNRAGNVADIREEVNFQITLQSEQEITKLLKLVKEIHEHQGLALKKDLELEHMVQNLNPDELEEEIEQEFKETQGGGSVRSNLKPKRRSRSV